MNIQDTEKLKPLSIYIKHNSLMNYVLYYYLSQQFITYKGLYYNHLNYAYA